MTEELRRKNFVKIARFFDIALQERKDAMGRTKNRKSEQEITEGTEIKEKGNCVGNQSGCDFAIAARSQRNFFRSLLIVSIKRSRAETRRAQRRISRDSSFARGTFCYIGCAVLFWRNIIPESCSFFRKSSFLFVSFCSKFLFTPLLRCVLAMVFLSAIAVCGAPSWQEELAKMPLTAKPAELDGRNCAPVLFNSFQRGASVQAIILMPGATDELYFFRRVHARLTNDAPTLLDAISALTNQSFIQATFRPPLLLLHTVEDPLEPDIVVKDERTADRIRKKHFEKRAIFYDKDWDFVEPILAFDLDTRLSPGLRSHDSHHFFRHSLVEFGLNGWDALEAIALAGKTKVTIERKRIVFKGDTRYRELPPSLGDFIPDESGKSK
jgi:hypothetical protein